MRFAALALALVSIFGTRSVSAVSLDDGAEYIKLQDPMFIKFMDIKDGSHVLLEGLVGSIQASHSSYSRNTFFVKSQKDDFKVLVTSPVDVKVSIKDERCVRVRGTINMSGEIPTIRLPEPIENEQNAVFCDTAVKWWSNTE